MPYQLWGDKNILIAGRRQLEDGAASVSEGVARNMSFIERIADHLPLVGPERAKRHRLDKSIEFPVGHYHSPYPDLAEVERHKDRIWAVRPSFPGIDLNEGTQLQLLGELGEVCRSNPFKSENTRYSFANNWFGPHDALVLHGLIRLLQPKQIVEVGCGWSSAVILDSISGRTRCTFIEPRPERLQKLLRVGDLDANELRRESLQDSSFDFSSLQQNDILFFDGSHVAKPDSDVNKIFFEILPCLAPGVWVHVHDIGYPFEMPRNWVMGGRAWNEVYVAHAFLQFNSAYKIQYWSSYIGALHRAELYGEIPDAAPHNGGSLWMKRVK